MILIVCISGDGGGIYGPDGSYQILKQLCDSLTYCVDIIDTIPNDTIQNTNYICNKILNCASRFEKIYIIGWSLGTVVAVNCVYQLSMQPNPIKIDGIILISSIRRYMEHFDQIYIPIGFIHGKLDMISPYRNSYYWFNRTPFTKLMHIYDQCGHMFTDYGNKLATDVINIISELESLAMYT